MNKNRWIVLGGLLTTLLVTGVVGTTAAFADEVTPPAPPDERAGVFGGRPGQFPAGPRGPRGLGPAELDAAATALGMTTDDLSAAFKDGKTLEDVATAQSVEIQVVQNAIQAAHRAQMLEDINQAVTDGHMTQDKADWLILGLQNGYLDGPGFGPGRGVGFGGPKGAPVLAPQATQQSAN